MIKNYKNIKIVCLFTLCLFLVSCQETSYTKGGLFGGYKVNQNSNTSYEVTYEVNGLSPEGKDLDLALLKASQISFENDFDYFVADLLEANKSFLYQSGSILSKPKVEPQGSNVKLYISLLNEETEESFSASSICSIILEKYPNLQKNEKVTCYLGKLSSEDKQKSKQILAKMSETVKEKAKKKTYYYVPRYY